MGSKVTLIVALNREGRELAISRTLDTWLVENAFRPVDRPKAGVDVFSKMMCDSPVIIEATMRDRKTIAKLLTDAILDAMGAKDTEMGYPCHPKA